MNLATSHTRAKVGVEAPAVTVETHLSNGLPSLSIVGLPETGVKESKDRVRSALMTAGFDFPARRITINLAPADLPKEGSRFDLAIAIGILAASGQIPPDSLERTEFLGELSLDGQLRPVQGILPAVVSAQEAGRGLILPGGNAEEAALAGADNARAASHLLAVCAHLRGDEALPVIMPASRQSSAPANLPDLADVQGQVVPKRALEVAAAGNHNLLNMCPYTPAWSDSENL